MAWRLQDYEYCTLRMVRDVPILIMRLMFDVFQRVIHDVESAPRRCSTLFTFMSFFSLPLFARVDTKSATTLLLYPTRFP